MTPAAVPPEPGASSDVALLLGDYLDFYRESVVAKLDGLDDDQLRTSLLPSGWSPIELLGHLVHMERRWLIWGFLGEAVAEPWADNRGAVADADWFVPPLQSVVGLIEALRSGGRRTRQIIAAHRLTEIAPPGPRFGDRPPASLLAICLHVVNEYARHLGHLDVARELVDGRTGE